MTRTVEKAPADGKVTELKVENGASIKAGQGILVVEKVSSVTIPSTAEVDPSADRYMSCRPKSPLRRTAQYP